MARIETYINAQSPLSGSDKMIGTDSANNNETKNFTVSELANFINSGSGFVPYTGATQDLALGSFDMYLQDMYLNKVNTSEIDITTALYLNNNQGIVGDVLTSQGSGLAPIWTAATGNSYKVYSAIVEYGGATPTVIELQNTLGVTITWFSNSNISASAAIFTANKTVITANPYTSILGVLYNNIGYRVNDTTLALGSIETSTNSSSRATARPFFIEIRVYP
jgi:hypothetical protein